MSNQAIGAGTIVIRVDHRLLVTVDPSGKGE